MTDFCGRNHYVVSSSEWVVFFSSIYRIPLFLPKSDKIPAAFLSYCKACLKFINVVLRC